MRPPLLLLLPLLAGCASPSGTDAGALDAGAADAGHFQATVLQTLTLDSGVTFELLRLEKPGQAASYARWFPPPVDDGGVQPVVVMTQPYDGIDWTGEAVDARWAQQGAGLFPDVDGPGYDGGGQSIVYTPQTHETAASDAFLWRLHGFGVLMVYGRYYAGGDVQNDLDDMTVGFDFLAQVPTVDRAHLGIIGGSWGGFEALYGAAYARPDVRPTVGVALYPLSDFQTEVQWVTQTLPARYQTADARAKSQTFFDPYLRRLAPTVARNGGYAGLTGADLVSRITAPFLLLHEDWDTLVAFEESQALVSLAADRFAPLWLLHAAPPAPWDQTVNQHGQLLTSLGGTTDFTFVWAYLLGHLGRAGQPLFVPWDAPNFRALMTLMHDRQAEGKDVRFFAQRLSDLCDPRIITYEMTSGATATGAATVSAELDAVWGTHTTEATVRQTLAQGLP
jgi:dienelactone hydrolase